MAHRNTEFSLRESNVKSYCRSIPCVLAKANGTEVWDVDNNRYIDFLAGAGSLNYGHNNPVLQQALLEYIGAGSITHSLDIMTRAKADFLDSFGRHVLDPRNLDYRIQFTGPTGTNAVEAAFKLARKVTGRSNIVAFTNGFHGVSMGSLAATGNRYMRNAAGTPLSGTSIIPYENFIDNFDSMNYFEAMLDDSSSGLDFPAAVVVETVQGEGGLKAATTQWLRRLSDICSTRDILLIVDDIQSGCGRTGTFFSFEEAGIKPDMVVLSKSLSGFGLPMSLLLMRTELDQWQPGEHNGTFRGNNHAFITAASAINQYWTDDTFSTHVSDKALLVESRMQSLKDEFDDHIVEHRGRGFMRGIQCACAKQAEAVTGEAFNNGLIIERSGSLDEVVKFLAPLTTPVNIIDEGFDILQSAMRKVFHAKPSTHEAPKDTAAAAAIA